MSNSFREFTLEEGLMLLGNQDLYRVKDLLSLMLDFHYEHLKDDRFGINHKFVLEVSDGNNPNQAENRRLADFINKIALRGHGIFGYDGECYTLEGPFANERVEILSTFRIQLEKELAERSNPQRRVQEVNDRYHKFHFSDKSFYLQGEKKTVLSINFGDKKDDIFIYLKYLVDKLNTHGIINDGWKTCTFPLEEVMRNIEINDFNELKHKRVKANLKSKKLKNFIPRYFRLSDINKVDKSYTFGINLLAKES
ncbi:hypothetical protein COV25_04195 [candidate division WWE3 bacterium CG10_big_fil_rev_8_21_14_0_10_35_32]|nr:MAG: hypothetical protein COV25_04195 [candidate division WWE3 bacterium CG10_big_fil_rev_8_21_14_0_10_35_32]